MNETITFENMPKAMVYLINKVEALEKALLEKNELFNLSRLDKYQQ